MSRHFQVIVIHVAGGTGSEFRHGGAGLDPHSGWHIMVVFLRWFDNEGDTCKSPVLCSYNFPFAGSVGKQAPGAQLAAEKIQKTKKK